MLGRLFHTCYKIAVILVNSAEATMSTDHKLTKMYAYVEFSVLEIIIYVTLYVYIYI